MSRDEKKAEWYRLVDALAQAIAKKAGKRVQIPNGSVDRKRTRFVPVRM